ncbi:MAG: hypothetical protein ABMA14_00615 [Hyphomonadaceae bacterium]
MKFSDCVCGIAAVGALSLGLGACSGPAPTAVTDEVAAPVATLAVPADTWSAAAADAAASVVQASRTVPLTGGGELVLLLSCNFRPSPDPVMNGFWLKMDLTLKGANGASLGLDPLLTNEQTARFPVVRSTGEAGTLTVTIVDPTHFVYENNQTNELNQDNNDPAKVELATSFDLPLSDGRTITIQTQKEDAGYKDTLTRCAALPQK